MKNRDAEICDACGAQFSASKSIVDGGMRPDLPIKWPSIQPLVRCRACSHVFPSTTYRYFGFISPKVLRYGLSVYVTVFLLIFCAILASGALRGGA